MTFQEWFNSAPHRAKYTNDHPAYLAAQEAWEAAHEACAQMCERMAKRTQDIRSAALEMAAENIRARSTQ